MKKRFDYENIVIIILAFVFLIIGINYGLNVYDEANPLVGAMRINNGEVPYINFWAMYGPGQYYLTSTILKIFGNNLLIIRLISALFMSIISLYVYKIASIYYPRKYALSVLVLILVYGSWFNFYGRGILTALMLLMIGLYYLMKYKDEDDGNKSKYYIISALAFGVSVSFRHDFAVYIALLTIAYFVFQYIDDKKINWKMFAVYSTILIVSIGIPYLVLIHFAGYNNVAEQLIRIPSQVFADYRSLQLPIPFRNYATNLDGMNIKYILSQLSLLSFYLPFVIIGVTVYYAIYKNTKAEKMNSMLLIAVLSLLLLNQGRVRCDFEHIVPSLLVGFLLLPFIVRQFKTREMRLLVYIPLMLVLTVPAFAHKINKVIHSFNLNGTEYLNVQYAESISIDAQWQKQYKKTIEYIKGNTKTEERIFICNNFNDKITINDMMLYFLTQRLPATKYHELHPGVATEDYAQKEIIKDLISKRTKMIIKVANNYSPEPNKSSISGSKRLDNFLNLNYELVEQFGDYSILKAKGNF